MALVTYADIQASLASYLWDRDDLTTVISDCIVLCEARLNSQLRVSQMETSASITITSGSGPLPSDYLAYRRVLTQDNPVRALEWAEPEWAEDHYVARTTASGLASHFTIVGSTIVTYPPSASNLTMRYYQKIPALATNTAGNWITNRAPGLYIYGTLVELEPFLDDDDRVMTWASMYKAAKEDLELQDKMARYAKPVMRVSGATP